MVRYDAGTTNPTLLNRLGDWRDHEAWVDFVTRYDPVIRSISVDTGSTPSPPKSFASGSGSTWRGGCAPSATTPGRRFAVGSAGCANRGRSICCGRRMPIAVVSLEDQPVASLVAGSPADIEVEEDAASERPALAPPGRGGPGRRSATGRANGRGRFSGTSPSLGSPCARLRTAAGISYYAAFAAQKRVRPDAPRGGATAPGRTAGA